MLRRAASFEANSLTINLRLNLIPPLVFLLHGAYVDVHGTKLAYRLFPEHDTIENRQHHPFQQQQHL